MTGESCDMTHVNSRSKVEANSFIPYGTGRTLFFILPKNTFFFRHHVVAPCFAPRCDSIAFHRFESKYEKLNSSLNFSLQFFESLLINVGLKYFNTVCEFVAWNKREMPRNVNEYFLHTSRHYLFHQSIINPWFVS